MGEYFSLAAEILVDLAHALHLFYAERAAALGIRGTVCKTVGEAYEAAVAEGRLTVICGSLYLYRDLMLYLNAKHHGN